MLTAMDGHHAVDVCCNYSQLTGYCITLSITYAIDTRILELKIRHTIENFGFNDQLNRGSLVEYLT